MLHLLREFCPSGHARLPIRMERAVADVEAVHL
jgi:hypothetical protein